MCYTRRYKTSLSVSILCLLHYIYNSSHRRRCFVFKPNHLYRRVVHALHIKPFINFFAFVWVFSQKDFDEDDYIGYEDIKELINRQTGEETLTAMDLERLIET